MFQINAFEISSENRTHTCRHAFAPVIWTWNVVDNSQYGVSRRRIVIVTLNRWP